ncbi:MAG: 4Fe-4S dicluster domain-containing protein [bacterium]|nr:4Fe-4S dicluster domain-containing protein [bacterium]
MKKKGLISAQNKSSVGEGTGRGIEFVLIPFIVGIYENQGGRMDEELAALTEKYYKEGLHKIMSVTPSVHRVIPVEKTIPVNVEVMPYERASTYINNAKSWGVCDCMCRVQKQLVGEGCGHSLENCLSFSDKPGAYDRSKRTRAISREEALQILEEADREGLVHSPENIREGVGYICNCCTCCCGITRAIAEYGHFNAIGRSDFYAVIDHQECSGCGLCIDRCQFKALHMNETDGVCDIDKSHCYGCGLCISTCPTGALSLVQKSAAEIEPPPKSESEWREKRVRARMPGASGGPAGGQTFRKV